MKFKRNRKQFFEGALRLSYIPLLLLLVAIGCSKVEKEHGKEGNSNESEIVSQIGFDPRYQYDLSKEPVAKRNFYALIELGKNERASQEIKNDSVLINSYENKIDLFKAEIKRDNSSVSSIGKTLLFSQEEISNILERIQHDAMSKEFESLINKELRPSGTYQLYVNQENSQFLKYAIRECLKGINKIINVYTQGVIPLDPVDDFGYYHKDKNSYKSGYLDTLKRVSVQLLQKMDSDKLFFQPSLDFALMLLKLNRREEAGSFEPLKEGENKLAYENLPKINWDSYPYSVIVVLGSSPHNSNSNMTKSEKEKVKDAVQKMKEGLAPLIILSGADMNISKPGDRPAYYEAIEMKKYMMSSFQIDEKNIIIEPHARHTTSNLRNSSRLIYRYEIPSQRKGLILTTKSHMDYVVGNGFSKRCYNDYGYMPCEIGERVSSKTVEFIPNLKSLQTAPSLDPLDP